MGPDDDGSDSFREHVYSAQDGLRLYYREYGPSRGDRLPVLCLPGLTRNCKDFDDLARHLGRERRVLCPDYRGRGRSSYDRNWCNYGPRGVLDDLRHLLTATHVHDFVVIGTSFGGALAAALAVVMPCAVRGAIINDMGPELERTNLHRMLKHVGDDNPMPDWPTAVQRLRTALPGLPAHSEEDWLKAARNTYREVHGQIRPDWDIAIARLIPGMVEESVDLWALFRALARVPILAVRGEKSEILSARTLERMADALPGLIPVTVPEVGHAPDLAAQNVQGKVDGYLAQF